jgi:hypothetical protein
MVFFNPNLSTTFVDTKLFVLALSITTFQHFPFTLHTVMNRVFICDVSLISLVIFKRFSSSIETLLYLGNPHVWVSSHLLLQPELCVYSFSPWHHSLDTQMIYVQFYCIQNTYRQILYLYLYPSGKVFFL